MTMNDWRNETIALLLSCYTEDEVTEREQARAEYESMSDEELSCALGTIRYEAEQRAKLDYQADMMDILEERGE